MDITKCYELLESRSKEQPNFTVKHEENGEITVSVNVEHYSVDKISSLSTNELLLLFGRLQEERICVSFMDSIYVLNFLICFVTSRHTNCLKTNFWNSFLLKVWMHTQTCVQRSLRSSTVSVYL